MNIDKVNLAKETQEFLESLNVNIEQVIRVEFYNSHELQMQQCTYDEFDQIAKDIWYVKCIDGVNCRAIHPDLSIQIEGGYIERATEEDGFDGWISKGIGLSLVDYEPTVGKIQTTYII